MYWIISGEAELAAEVNGDVVRLMDKNGSITINNPGCIAHIFQGCQNILHFPTMPDNEALIILQKEYKYGITIRLAHIALSTEDDFDLCIESAELLDIEVCKTIQRDHLKRFVREIRPIEDYPENLHEVISVLHTILKSVE